MSNIFSTTVVILRIYTAYILVNSSLSAAALFMFIGKVGTSDQPVDMYMAATGLSTDTKGSLVRSYVYPSREYGKRNRDKIYYSYERISFRKESG